MGLLPPNIDKLRQRADVHGLMAALAHKEPSVAHQAAKALSELQDARIPDLLVGALADEKSRHRAALLLGEMGDRRASDGLVEMLGRADRPDLRERAALALGDLGDARAVEALITLIKTSKSGPFRARAARALGNFNEPRVIVTLAEVVGDPANRERDFSLYFLSLSALARIGDASAFEPLKRWVRNEDPIRNIKELGILTRYGDKWALEQLRRILLDPEAGLNEMLDDDTRRRYPAAQGRPPLTAERTRISAAEALRDAGGVEALTALLDSVQGDWGGHEGAGATQLTIEIGKAIVELADERIADRLVEMLKHPSPDWVVEAVGRVGDVRAIELLKDRLAHARWDTYITNLQRSREPLYTQRQGPAAGNITHDTLVALIAKRDGSAPSTVPQSVIRCCICATNFRDRGIGTLNVYTGSVFCRRCMTIENKLSPSDFTSCQSCGFTYPQNLAEFARGPEPSCPECESPIARVEAPFDSRYLDGLREILYAPRNSRFGDERGRAAEALARCGDPQAINQLLDAVLTVELDATVRVAAVEALAKVGDARAVPKLLSALEIPEPTEQSAEKVREAIAQALGKFGDKAAVGPLLKILTEKGPGWIGAVRGLVNIADESVIEPLLASLKADQNLGAATVLGRFGVPAAAERLIRAAEGYPDDDYLRAINTILENAPGELGVDLLRRAARLSRAGVQKLAKAELDRRAERLAGLRQQALLASADAQRLSAVDAIQTLIAEQDWNDEFADSLLGMSSQIKAWRAPDSTSTATSQDREAYGAWVDTADQFLAAYAGAKQDRWQEMQRRLREEREQAIRAANMDDPRFLTSMLIEAARGEKWTQRDKAARRLVKIGTQAIPALGDALKDDSVAVRWSAADILGRIGTEAAATLLKALLVDEDEGVRDMAAQGLESIDTGPHEGR